MGNWNDLSMRDRRDVMRLHLSHGINSLDDIRENYNTYDNGGQQSLYIGKKIKYNKFGDPISYDDGSQIEWGSSKSSDDIKAEQSKDIYGNTMIPKNIISTNSRTYYDPRQNATYLGSDWKGADGKWQDQTLAHENRHALQFKTGESNFDIAHNTDNSTYSKLLQPPLNISNDETYYGYHNRKGKEVDVDANIFGREHDTANFIPKQVLFNKQLDKDQYTNTNSLENQAQIYGDTGTNVFDNNKIKFASGGYIIKNK